MVMGSALLKAPAQEYTVNVTRGGVVVHVTKGPAPTIAVVMDIAFMENVTALGIIVELTVR